MDTAYCGGAITLGVHANPIIFQIKCLANSGFKAEKVSLRISNATYIDRIMTKL